MARNRRAKANNDFIALNLKQVAGPSVRRLSEDCK
jgi:hypothetical protein